VTAELDGELLVYEEQSGAIHTLNPTASVVWSCIDGRATVDDIVAELAVAYGADPRTVEADLLALLGQLRDLGLLDDGTVT
jgi:PqqD family protein of HPr-rel-A system